MASIRKRGHRWEVRIRHKNKPTKCKTFTSKADALSWANKTEYLIETEAHTVTPPTLFEVHFYKNRTFAGNDSAPVGLANSPNSGWQTFNMGLEKAE